MKIFFFKKNFNKKEKKNDEKIKVHYIIQIKYSEIIKL